MCFTSLLSTWNQKNKITLTKKRALLVPSSTDPTNGPNRFELDMEDICKIFR